MNIPTAEEARKLSLNNTSESTSLLPNYSLNILKEYINKEIKSAIDSGNCQCKINYLDHIPNLDLSKLPKLNQEIEDWLKSKGYKIYYDISCDHEDEMYEIEIRWI